MFKIVEDIEKYIAEQPWLDFEITQYDGRSLTVTGSLHDSTNPIIKIEFTDVFAVSAPFCWRSDTTKPVFTILSGDAMVKFNLDYQIEQGYSLFKFEPEDLTEIEGCIVAAKALSFSLSGE